MSLKLHRWLALKEGGGRLLLSSAILVLAAGCKRESVEAYSVPKETSQFPAALATVVNKTPAPGMRTGEEPPPAHLHWTTPAAWQERQATGLRVGSFSAKGANGQVVDISIIPLSSHGGGELGDVNRWRGQVGLGETTAEDLEKEVQVVEAAGQKTRVFDLVGTKLIVEDKHPARILVGMLPYKGTTYYIKMTGEASATGEHKPAFLEFLKSITIDESDHSVAANDAPAPGGAPDQLTWTKPPGWKEQAPGSVRLASFTIESPEGKAEVSITVFPGDTGGLTANVNRWRKQIGLPELTSDEQLTKLITPMDVDGVRATLVEVPAADGKTDPKTAQKTLALMRTKAGRSWFVKMTGDDAVVTAERVNFIQFILNLRFPNA